ncbi:hypothetical protein AgCh_006075 [Apium graveolens]
MTACPPALVLTISTFFLALALTVKEVKDEMHLETLLFFEVPKKREDEEMESEEEREWDGVKEREGADGIMSLEEGVVNKWREQDEETDRLAIFRRSKIYQLWKKIGGEKNKRHKDTEEFKQALEE